MPWPLLLWIGGALVAGILGLGAYAAWSEYQEEKAEEARERARRQASRRQEEEAVKRAEKLNKERERINKEYGKNIPKEKAESMMTEAAEIYGTLKGNREGLEAQGKSASDQARKVEDMLAQIRSKAMKK